MRIVFFDLTQNDAINYPAEGISAFGKTVVHDNKVIGEYIGNASEEDLPTWPGSWPVTIIKYKTALKPGEMIKLLSAEAFTAINIAAYPSDGSAPDANALYFLESAKRPYSADELVIVNEAPVTTAMAYFVSAGYISQDNVDTLMAGIPYEEIL